MAVEEETMGKEVEIRIAATEAALLTAVPIPHVNHWSVDPGQDFEHVPKGMGMGRGQRVHDKLLKPKGQIRRHYDSVAVKGTDIFWNAVQSTNTGAISASYVEIRIVPTKRRIIIRGAKGNCPTEVDLEGYVTETWDFLAEEISETSYS